MAGRDDFPYTPVPNSFRRLLEKIPSVGTPDKVDGTWLAGLGFGGGNNKMSIALMRQLGILDAASKPTDFWKAIRAKDRAKIAAGVKQAYAALFAMYPDAQRQDDEALMAFARAHTDYAAGTARFAVRTFRALADLGDFDTATSAQTQVGEDASSVRNEGGSRRVGRGSAGQPGTVGLTVNIQLQLPPSTDGAIYDKLFEAMAKHLKGLVTLE